MSATWLRLSGALVAFVLLLVVQVLLSHSAGAAPAALLPTPTPTPTPGPVRIVPAFGGFNFGTTPIGTPRDATVWIYNDGATAVNMNFPSLTNPTGFAIVGLGPLYISGHSSSFVTVRLLASQRGTFGTSLMISFSNYNHGFPTYVPFQGQVTAPLIRVTDGSSSVAPGSQVNLGSTPFNVPKDKQFVIYNDGDATLTVGLNNFLTGSGYFLIEAPASSVGPNSSTTFTIRLLANSSGTFNGTVSIPNNDSTHNPYTFSLIGTVGAPPPTPTPVPPAPRLGLVSGDGVTITYNSSYAFPSTPACVAVSRGFTISNNGTATLAIYGVSVTGEGWSITQDPPGSIPVGTTGAFRLRLLSCTGGDKIGQVTINSNDPVHPNFRFTVTGTVTGAGVRVVSGDGITIGNGGSYAFPATPAGTAVGRAFTIYNDGNAPLTISNMTVTGEGFSLLIAPPATIDAHSSGVFRVRLLSGTAGNKSGQVSFNTNDPQNNPFSFTVTGTVTP
jgi:hypothetical protein